MSQQTNKPERPAVVNRVPSANWRKFIEEYGSGEERRLKRLQVPRDHRLDANMVSFRKEDVTSKLIQRLPGVCAIDCEMVGAASPVKDMLARVSVVNMQGNCIYDKYVKPTDKVIDYRTPVSGIRPSDLRNGEAFDIVRQEVAVLLKNKIVVGHSVGNDFRVLKIKHPKRLLRDTAYFPAFTQMFNGKTPSLRNLARVVLGVNIQSGEHSSVQDAKATLQLYMTYRYEWEKYIHNKYSKSNRSNQPSLSSRRSTITSTITSTGTSTSTSIITSTNGSTSTSPK